ncbi:1,3-beta-glucanosyltransferase GAS2 [Smittium culicis]|uniref:1,3-beta-glucanosyltransferase n=1 Tax=Smittium culicis TaxID=133412 RepID=A0A1R1YDI3_9FUNG|nr:1,3-beta-glucanosyltransferase GAS2 [Smittium culicis]
MKIRILSFILSLGLTFAIDPLVFKGRRIYNAKTNLDFDIKGIVYQPRQGAPDGTLDPLADEIGCLRDVEVFKDLGINAIRVFEIDPTKNHDVCMKALSDAGIYLLLDLSTPELSIPRNKPYWDTYLLDLYKLKVDAFTIYDNIFGFVAGNNVTINVDTVPASAFVKASIRDIKNYLKFKNNNIPVGYSGNFDVTTSYYSQRYFGCGSDPLAMADFYGYSLNEFDADIHAYSDYFFLKARNSKISYTPSFISQYIYSYSSSYDKFSFGPNSGTPANPYSGGFLFEYSNEGGDYGLVNVTYGNPSVNKLPIYEQFKKSLNQFSSLYTQQDPCYDFKPSTVLCELSNSNWTISNSLPPPPSVDLCDCLSKTFTCKLPSTFNQSDPNQLKALNSKISDLCNNVDCSDILTDPLKNLYGKYSGCTISQKANLILSLNFSKNNNTAQSCSIDGLNQSLVINSTALNISTCKVIAENYSSKYLSGEIDFGSSGYSNCTVTNSGSYTYSTNISHLSAFVILISFIFFTL